MIVRDSPGAREKEPNLLAAQFCAETTPAPSDRAKTITEDPGLIMIRIHKYDDFDQGQFKKTINRHAI
jgi:hypothetical protein